MSMDDPSGDEPVRLFEDADTGDRFLIYNTEKGLRVELRYEGDALWMTQAQMAGLFGVDRTVITKHLSNVYEDGELDQGATSAKIAQVRIEGGREVTRQIEHYNLDAVISVGYRVSSTQATLFRRWATTVLVRFATKGFVVDVERLRDAGDIDRIAELRELIRDIRSSEANLYAELRRICSMCQDYDPKSESSRAFYQRTQAKLFFAVVNRTPSELVVERADAKLPNMGLQNWPKDQVRQQDAIVAKNYLAPQEIRELNRLTTILLDIFEDQLEVGRLVVMEDAATLLESQLRSLGRMVLSHGGTVPHDRAEARAKAEYKKFDTERRVQRPVSYAAEIADLRQQDKALPKVPASPPVGLEGPKEQLDTIRERRVAAQVAAALDLTMAELNQLEWRIEENNTEDGILVGHIISFHEGSAPEILEKIDGAEHGWVQIGPL